MSDETAPDATQDTPTTEQPTAEEVDWRKRYDDLRPEFDRSRQTLSDKEALLRHIEENFPDLIAEDEPEPEEPPDEYDDDDPEPLTRKEFEEWRKAQFDTWRGEVDGERGSARYEADLSELLAGREIDKRGRKVIRALTVEGGDNRKALEQAVNEWFEIQPPAEPEAEPEKGKKKAPHVVAGGQPATAVKDWSEMTRDEIDEHMLARARALDAQT